MSSTIISLIVKNTTDRKIVLEEKETKAKRKYTKKKKED